MVTSAQTCERREDSWYDLIGKHLPALASMFALNKQKAQQLRRTYDLIGKESLALPAGTQSARPSRLNQDGTPIQFALALGSEPPALQFLSEIGDSSLSSAECLQFVTARLQALAALLQLNEDLDSLISLLRRLAAVDVHDTDPDRGGAFWAGCNFSDVGSGAKLYINGRHGTDECRWARFHDFAAFFQASELLPELRERVSRKMAPLGMAVSLGQSGNLTGRIYLSGYGNHVSFYENLLGHFVDKSDLQIFPVFAEHILQEDCRYPTQSVVFSVGFGSGATPRWDVKVEFCCHCLFQNDEQARQRCLRWLELRRINARIYEKLLSVIAGRMDTNAVNTHVYFGLGWKKKREYTTIYLKPRLHEMGSLHEF